MASKILILFKNVFDCMVRHVFAFLYHINEQTTAGVAQLSTVWGKRCEKEEAENRFFGIRTKEKKFL